MTDPRQLIEAWQHGTLSPQQTAELSDWLRDPANARTFAREAFIHQRLRDMLHRDEAHDTVAIPPTPTLRTPTPVGGRSVWYTTAALAAALAIALTAWFMLTMSSPSEVSRETSSLPVAMLSNHSSDAVFDGTARPMNLGGELPPGPIRLTSGSAQVMFNSGAVVDLLSPCTFELTGPNHGRLETGFVTAFVPDEAVGFTIEARDRRFIDMGTRFVLWTAPRGGAELHVFEGLVMVEPTRHAQTAVAGSQTVHRGQSWRRPADSSAPRIVDFDVNAVTPEHLSFTYRVGASIAMPTLNWDAAEAVTGDRWSPNFARGEPITWRLHGSAGADAPTLVDVTPPSRLRIARACRFAGGLTTAGVDRMLPGRDGNLTLELLVKPADLLGREILFEAGGDANGFCLLLDGPELKLRLDQDNIEDLAGDRSLQATHRLTGRDIADFMQIVAVIDVERDRIELYVNGQRVAAAQTPNHGRPAGDLRGWAGGNPDAIGSANAYRGENLGGDDDGALHGYTAFDGLIAAVRFYENQRLTPQQINTNYQAMFIANHE